MRICGRASFVIWAAMKIPIGIAAVWLLAVGVPSAGAALVYTESVDDELSGSGMMPTVLARWAPMAVGSSSISA